MIRGLLSRSRRRATLLASLAAVSLAVACTPFSTYPPVETGEALVPWMYPVPQVMSKAIRTTYEKTSGAIEVPDGAPALVYALPEGISEGVWRQVGIDTGIEGARAMVAADESLGTPVWAVEQVRIRNRRAEVDVVFPVAEGSERATVILESDPFQPYQVAFFQRWRVPVAPPVFTGTENPAPTEDPTEDQIEDPAEAIETETVEEVVVEESSGEVEVETETESEIVSEDGG